MLTATAERLIFPMMKNKCEETSYYDAYGFDLQDGFSQFMEEARNHGKEAKLKSSSVQPEGDRKKKSEGEKNGKKSWKNSLVSWWKADKKSKNRVENTNNNSQFQVSGKKKGQAVSGPMYSTGKYPDRKFKRSTSGTLTNLFKPTMRLEDDMPYMSLHHQSSPPVQSYGPVYKIT